MGSPHRTLKLSSSCRQPWVFGTAYRFFSYCVHLLSVEIDHPAPALSGGAEVLGKKRPPKSWFARWTASRAVAEAACGDFPRRDGFDESSRWCTRAICPDRGELCVTGIDQFAHNLHSPVFLVATAPWRRVQKGSAVRILRSTGTPSDNAFFMAPWPLVSGNSKSPVDPRENGLVWHQARPYRGIPMEYHTAVANSTKRSDHAVAYALEPRPHPQFQPTTSIAWRSTAAAPIRGFVLVECRRYGPGTKSAI